MIRKFAVVIAAGITFGATVGMVSTPALAATVEEVVNACDKMDKDKAGSCSYKIYQKTVQGMSGCAGNVCFDCPADGKRLCFAVPGKGGKVGTTQLPSP
jgi:hypothetical protein